MTGSPARIRRRVTPLAALIVAWVAALPATQVVPTFRVGADLVVIDLVAFDRHGRFVADLQASDLELSEDGQVQTIQSVRLAGATRRRR